MGCDCKKTYSIGMGCCQPVLAPADNFYTKYQTDMRIEEAISGITVSGITEEQAEEMIEEATSGKANSSDVYTKPEVNDLLADKQDKLTAGTGIDITNNVISVTGGSQPVDAYTKAETDALLDGKADADDVYKKTETSSKTEIDDALLLDAYENYKTKNTYTSAFPSLTETADWNTAIQGGVYAMHSDLWEDDSYEMLFKLQVIDENGNTFSAATRNITERSFTVDNVNPLPDYIDVVRPTYEQSYQGRALASWIFKPKDGYRISYAQIDNYWEDEFRRHNNITEIEWYDAFPSGYTKDIIENYIEPKLANAQEKLSFDDNVRLRTSEGKLVPYVPTDYAISDWYSGSTNPVQTKAVYNYTYSKAETDSLLNEKADASNVYTKTEVDNKVSVKPNVWCGSESEWSQISGSTESGTIYLVY